MMAFGLLGKMVYREALRRGNWLLWISVRICLSWITFVYRWTDGCAARSQSPISSDRSLLQKSSMVEALSLQVVRAWG